MTQPRLSVVVPGFNEEAVIASFVATLRERLDAIDRSYEVVVVDNASTDGTVAALEPLLDGASVRLLRNEVNRGKGFSVRRGMLDASGELRLMCDADCNVSLGSLPELIEAVDEADVAIRLARGRGSCGRPGSSPCAVGSVGWPFIALTRGLMREPAHDIYCGFKLWRAPAAEAVFTRQRLDGWAFDAEALGACAPARLPRPRGRYCVGRPGGVEAVDPAGPGARGPRVARRSPERAEPAPGARRDGPRAQPAARLGLSRRVGRDHALALGFAAVSFGLAFLQRPGWATSDTKIDLHVDPVVVPGPGGLGVDAVDRPRCGPGGPVQRLPVADGARSFALLHAIGLGAVGGAPASGSG